MKPNIILFTHVHLHDTIIIRVEQSQVFKGREISINNKQIIFNFNLS